MKNVDKQFPTSPVTFGEFIFHSQDVWDNVIEIKKYLNGSINLLSKLKNLYYKEYDFNPFENVGDQD